jgi:pimeloyl-ACP methyl ester carboxylesterase
VFAHRCPRGSEHVVLDEPEAFRAKTIEPGLNIALRPRMPSGEDIERLKQFAGEVLVVWGDADSYINVEQAEQQRHIFRRARIEHVPGAGHWPWLEQPDWVAACVSEFLRNQTAEPSKNG